MLTDISQARALLESEGWRFEINSRSDQLAAVELIASHSGLQIRSVTLAKSERAAWELLVAAGGP